MKDTIFDYIRAHPGTSFAELINTVNGFEGDLALCFTGYPNLVLWPSLSQAAVDALTVLLEERKIRISPSLARTYMIDGRMPMLPVAKRVMNYKQPRWLPVTLYDSAHKCGICGKGGGTVTVRESWLQAGGGFGAVPQAAWACPGCDKKEQRQLKSGRIKLAHLWRKKQACPASGEKKQ